MRDDFWSRRKAAVEAEARADADALRDAGAAATVDERSDEEMLEELGLPAPEAMERPEEVQTLLRATVPQRLKTRALRRLWRLNPVLANIDGLVDYGEDFTDAATVIEDLQTLYSVGKGMVSRLDEAFETVAGAREDPAETTAEEPDEPSETAPETPVASVRPPAAATITASPAPPPADTVALTPDLAVAPVRPARRMTFRFDTA